MARALVRIWKIKDNHPSRRWLAFLAPGEGTKHIGHFETWEAARDAASAAAREYLADPSTFRPPRSRSLTRVDDPSDGDDLIAMLSPRVLSHPARRLLAEVLVHLGRDLRSEDPAIRRAARDDMDAGRILGRYSLDDVANIFDIDGSVLRSMLLRRGGGCGEGKASADRGCARPGDGGRAPDRAAAAQ